MFIKPSDWNVRNKLKVVLTNIIIIFINYFIFLSVKDLSIFITGILFILCSLESTLITLFLTKENSYYDLLTSTYTREKIYYDLNKLIKNNQKFILMYIDLNNFKEINDLYGHIEGDKVLAAFGEKISNLGEDIKSYRMGGDEFVIVAGTEESTKMKLEKFITTKEFDFSYGISNFPKDIVESDDIDIIIENLIVIADTKMYERKLSKR